MNSVIQGMIKPDWNEIHGARDKCHSFLTDNKLSVEVVDAVIMVVHELLENALKYGNYERDDARITYTLKIGKKSIIVEVTNPIFLEESRHSRILDKTIQWIRGYQNPFEAYVERLKRVSIMSLDDKESGLGLVRVAYEGQAIIDFYVRDDNQISVSAEYQL
jgi:hypothetical protein